MNRVFEKQDPRYRYQYDAEFKALVDSMHAYLQQCHFTPHELRQASILACINYERENVKHHIVPITAELEEALDTVEAIADKTFRNEI